MMINTHLIKYPEIVAKSRPIRDLAQLTQPDKVNIAKSDRIS